MTLDQLRIFLAVAGRGHVTRAAEALNLTQSAVSSAVATLEARHGVKLFDRVGRGIVLTEEGRLFADAARKVLAEAETAGLLLDDLAREARGRLRIFASQTVASYWLPPKLVTLQTRHPGIVVTLEAGNSAGAVQAVQEGTADIGFVEGGIPREAQSGRLLHQVVAEDELVLVTGPGCTGTDDYRRLRWILREPGSGTRAVFDHHIEAIGMKAEALEIALELPSNEAVLGAVAAGPLATMLSRRAVPAHPGLQIRDVPRTPRPTRAFAALTHADRHRTRALEALFEVMAG